MTSEVCLILRSMSHVLKEQHQRVISWWEREWNQRVQWNRVTPILETAKTWITSKITTEKHFSFPLLSSSHRLPETGNVQFSQTFCTCSLPPPTPSLSTQKLSLLRIGYSDIPALSGSLYNTREGDKKQLQPNCLILHTSTILKSLCSHTVHMNCTSCVLGSECNIRIKKPCFNEKSIPRLHKHSPAFCSKVFSPKCLKIRPGFLISDFCRCPERSSVLTSWKKLTEKINPDQNHREGVFSWDKCNVAKTGDLPSLWGREGSEVKYSTSGGLW